MSKVEVGLMSILCVAAAILFPGCEGGGGKESAGGDHAATSQPARDSFVPGLSAGLVVLGDTYRDVTSIYGEPNWVYNHVAHFGDIGVSATFAGSSGSVLPDDQVRYIYANASFEGTYRGIGNGSGVNAVVTAMGGGEVSPNGESIDYYSKGISFIIGRDGNVDGFGIFAPVDL